MGVQLRKELVVRDNEGQWHSIKYENAPGSMTAYGPYDPDDRCFYCGDHLSGEAVLYWVGSNTREVDARKNPDAPSWRKENTDSHELLLHPGCFIEMTLRMNRDLHQIELVCDYHVLKNASPQPPKPEGEAQTKEGWSIWRKLRDRMRDLAVVKQ
jgi:hypothetical protein